MAVYQRRYTGYEGGVTSPRLRFLVVPRYALREVFASRLLVAVFVGGLVWPLACALMIYLHHNAAALDVLSLPISELVPIDGRFFSTFFLAVQARIAFVLALVVGPALVSPDLRNNGLALYLARPFSKVDYVLGKLSVLLLLLSALTWVPGLLLFAEQAYLAGGAWTTGNLFIAGGLLAGSAAWILVLALPALALSAWVKWKPVARLLFLAMFFLFEGLGALVNQLWETEWGDLLRLSQLFQAIRNALFHERVVTSLPPAAAWAALVALWVVSLLLLSRKVRAYEVVR